MQTREESDLTSGVLKQFTDQSYKNYKSYSYAAGVLETILWDISRDLPAEKRQELRERVENHTTFLKQCEVNSRVA